MKLKLRQIVESRIALERLRGQSLPIQTAFHLARVFKVIYAELQNYEQARLLLCEQYGILVKEKNFYDIPKEKEKEFLDELNQLLDTEIELVGVNQLSFDLLSEAKLSVEDCEAISWLIKFD